MPRCPRPDAPLSGTTTPWRAARILVIEDEPEERRALQLVLQTDRREVRAAAAGDEALAMLDQFRPDLVVMDWRMPGVSGAHLCRRIRARANAPPIVVVSSADEAFESAEDISAALRKPVDLGELQAVIGSRLPSEARRGAPPTR
jgi:DNA-binding response OmpR family regulator